MLSILLVLLPLLLGAVLLYFVVKVAVRDGVKEALRSEGLSRHGIPPR